MIGEQYVFSRHYFIGLAKQEPEYFVSEYKPCILTSLSEFTLRVLRYAYAPLQGQRYS